MTTVTSGQTRAIERRAASRVGHCLRRAIMLPLLACALGAVPVAGQSGDPAPRVVAERLQADKRVVLDGILDEPAGRGPGRNSWWRHAPAMARRV